MDVIPHSQLPVLPASQADILLPADAPFVSRSDTPAATAGVIIRLDPFSIDVPDAPNRLPESFQDRNYQELVLSIIASGGNHVPIHVRRISVEPARYLLVSGERRLRASRLAGLQVRAMILESSKPADDCIDRLRENLARAELTPWEFGQQIQHALQLTGMIQSQLAETLGVSLSKVNRADDLANLPVLIVSAFASPNDIRIRDIKRLKDAWAEDSDAVGLEVVEINEIKKKRGAVAGPQVVERIEKAVQAQRPPQLALCKPPTPQLLAVDGKVVGQWVLNVRGSLDIHLEVAMSELQRADLLDHIADVLQRKVLTKP